MVYSLVLYWGLEQIFFSPPCSIKKLDLVEVVGGLGVDDSGAEVLEVDGDDSGVDDSDEEAQVASGKIENIKVNTLPSLNRVREL